MPADAVPAPSAESVQPQMSGGGVVLINNTVEILLDQPIPSLDSPYGGAYAARMRGDTKADLFAVLVRSGRTPRHEVISAMRAITQPGIIRVVDGGPVTLSSDGQRCYAVAYERPMGRRLIDTMKMPWQPLNEDQIMRTVITPLVATLREMARAGIMHGEIRLTNLFWSEGGGFMQLGDYISGPCGYYQPLLFETIERGMCNPIGKGAGSITDDIYALGVLIALLHLGPEHPVLSMDDTSIMNVKLDRGSFHLLAGHVRLSYGLTELLRGMLNDAVNVRWSIADLDIWLTGRRPPAKQVEAVPRASRSFTFNENSYWSLRQVAKALAENPAAGCKAIEAGEIDRWLRRSLSDDDLAKEVQTTIDNLGSGRGGAFEDRLIASVGMVLDPTSPIRYRGQIFMPTALPVCMSDAINSGSSVQPFAEVVSNRLAAAWLSAQPDNRPEYNTMFTMLDKTKALVDRSGIGFGIERCLYELNTFQPCLSPMVRNYYPMTPKDVLEAIDTIAQKPNARPKEPIDRHIVGFIAAQDRRLNEAILGALAAPEGSSRRILGLLTFWSDVQSRHGPEKVPHLAAWMVGMIEPAIKRFFNRSLQEDLRKAAPILAKDGKLTELLLLVDNADKVAKDRKNFISARNSYRTIRFQMNKLQNDIDNQDGMVNRMGRPVAGLVATILGVILMAAGVIISISGGGGM